MGTYDGDNITKSSSSILIFRLDGFARTGKTGGTMKFIHSLLRTGMAALILGSAPLVNAEDAPLLSSLIREYAADQTLSLIHI